MLKFFRIPFATSGDKTAVPDAVDVNGFVSYTAGYGFDYQRQKTDPAAKNIERDKMNEIFFDITTALAELQSQGVPDFITSALNGGAPYSYAQHAVVRYSGDLYVSLEAANVAEPNDATKWALLPVPSRLQAALYTQATAGGTADALTGAFSPAIGSLPAAPGTLSVMVRAGAANATTTPTFAADATAAKTIVKGNNIPLAVGDVAGAGHWLHLDYDATLDKWVLQNPATGVSIASSPLHGQCYLALSAGSLKLSPKDGNRLMVNGVSCTIPDAGVTLSAAGLTPLTRYYIYATQSGGVINALEASTTGHSPDTTAGNKGVEIKTGDSTRTLVGTARPIAGPAFVDSGSQRLVLSWFNRQKKTAMKQAGATYSTASPSYVEFNSALRAEVLVWGGEDIDLLMAGSVSVGTGGTFTLEVGFGIDGSATAYNSNVPASASVTGATNSIGGGTGVNNAAEGYHYANILGRTSGSTMYLYSSTDISATVQG